MEFVCTAKMGIITINSERKEPITTEITFELGALHKTIVDNLRVSIEEVPSMKQFIAEVEKAVKEKLKIEQKERLEVK